MGSRIRGTIYGDRPSGTARSAIAQDFLSECESPNPVIFRITQYVDFVNIEEWTGDLAGDRRQLWGVSLPSVTILQ